MKNFKEEWNRRMIDINEILGKFLPAEEGCQKTLWEAVNYSFTAGGKRIRPIFMYETFRMFGGTDDDLIQPFLAAIEMIHTYSLVHDDLPALDNDDTRRGRPTTHKMYGEDIAVLAGDGLLNLAFETACKGFDRDLKKSVAALKILAEKAGGYGMIGGQTVDVEMTGKPVSEEIFSFIYKNKTGALIEASMMAGAVLAGAGGPDIQMIESIAEKVGFAFQIQDDILDMVGDEEKIGKPVHSDEKNEKLTLGSLYGEEKARKIAWEYSHAAVRMLRSLEEKESDASFLINLIESLMIREQ